MGGSLDGYFAMESSEKAKSNGCDILKLGISKLTMQTRRNWGIKEVVLALNTL